MSYDPIQERLKMMEEKNPSENEHPQRLLKKLSDTFLFWDRYRSEPIQEVPQVTSHYPSIEDRVTDCKKASVNAGFSGKELEWLYYAIDSARKGELWKNIERKIKYAENPTLILWGIEVPTSKYVPFDLVQKIFEVYQECIKTEGPKHVAKWVEIARKEAPLTFGQSRISMLIASDYAREAGLPEPTLN